VILVEDSNRCSEWQADDPVNTARNRGDMHMRGDDENHGLGADVERRLDSEYINIRRRCSSLCEHNQRWCSTLCEPAVSEIGAIRCST
jgi:hypothetical protein